MIGKTIGPYQILAELGRGGMGEVYRATDTHLKRSVAIKVLPAAMAADAERLARFQREAEVLAALNHPNIAAIYGLEKTSDLTALVMELVEGEDLSKVISRGPIPPSDALPMARQIAEALETAHEQGIVHRDLKPANIKVRADGTVKVLDFGLAKAMDPRGSGASVVGRDDGMNSPTMTGHATQMGIILGTAAYMSPEQARGKSVDKRADIWAFGVVLYEMLSGQQAFAGETITDIISAVVTRDPDWTALPATTTPAVRQLLTRCLEKDARRRLRDIGDARHVLDGDRSLSTSGLTEIAAAAPVTMPFRYPWRWVAATVMLAATTLAFAFAWWRERRAESVAGSYELAIAAPFDSEFQIGSNLGNVIVSPDGSKVAFVAATTKSSTLWVRSLQTGEAKSLSGTDNPSYPFWSPDGRHIGFFAGGKLRTVDIAGGLPEVIADAPRGRGGSWGDDDSILFTPIGGGSVMQVSARGGAVKTITKLDAGREEDAHYFPVLLPGSRTFLYFVRSRRVENGGIYLGRVDGSAPAVRLVASLSSGFLASRPSDGAPYLMWARDGDLLAQPFDVEAGTLRGEIVTIARGVRVEESQRLVFASASKNGVLAWAGAGPAEAVIARYSRDGRRLATLGIPPGDIAQPTLSPDGRRLAFLRVTKGSGDVFTFDMTTGAIQRLSPSSDYDEMPRWSPHDDTVIYQSASSAKGGMVLMQVAPGGGLPPKVVVPERAWGRGFATKDGRFLVHTVVSKDTGMDVMVQPLAGGAPTPLIVAPGDQNLVAMSPDGRWLVISEGPASVTIRRLNLDAATPWLGAPTSLGLTLLQDDSVTVRRDGRELYCLAADNTLKAVALTPAGDGVIVGAPTTLFKLPVGEGTFDVNADGTEFILSETPFAAGQTLRILTNWGSRLSAAARDADR